MKTKHLFLLLLFMLISRSIYANEFRIKWVLEENKFVTTQPNTTVYQTGGLYKLTFDLGKIEEHKDINFRGVINYTNQKTKKIRKPKSFLIRGIANKEEQLHYDTYVIEINGFLYYLPMEFAEDNTYIDSENTSLDNQYDSLLTQRDNYTKEIDSLRTHCLSICEDSIEYYETQIAQLPFKIDSIKDEIETQILSNWYNKLSPSAKNTYNNKIEITYANLKSPNSAGGCDYVLWYTNKSAKTIKYFDWSGTFYNAVNDRVYCDIRGYNSFEGRDTGPVETGNQGGGWWDCVIYDWAASYVKLENISITYIDGSSTYINAKDIKALLSMPDSDIISKAVAEAIKPYKDSLRKASIEVARFKSSKRLLSESNSKYVDIAKGEKGEFKRIITQINETYRKKLSLDSNISIFEMKNLMR